MSAYLPKPKSFGGRSYATEADLKNGTGVYTHKFAKKVDLASLKS